MPHNDIDVMTHLLLALYPMATLFAIEIISRVTKSKQWIKYTIQGFVCIIFATAYIALIDAVGIALMLIVLAPALFVQAKRIKNKS